MTLEEIQNVAAAVRERIGTVVIGQESAIDLLLIALLAEGHVLLEGVPGTGKTLLTQTFARLLNLEFRRIQFTPDLMPGDVVGSNLFDFQTSAFTLIRGPIFTQILLADEINRTPPKTQAALLEAMQERRVTLDGKNHDLGAGFMVLATQNPIEQEGTYPLPEAQLDRFLFKVTIDYPSRDHERHLVKLHGKRTQMPDLDAFGLAPLLSLDGITAIRETVRKVELTDPMVDYIVDLVRATRDDSALLTGASPRAANMLAVSARARAAMNGRGFVVPDDVKSLLTPALAHRIVLTPGSEIEGIDASRVLRRIIEKVPAPR